MQKTSWYRFTLYSFVLLGLIFGNNANAFEGYQKQTISSKKRGAKPAFAPESYEQGSWYKRYPQDLKKLTSHEKKRLKSEARRVLRSANQFSPGIALSFYLGQVSARKGDTEATIINAWSQLHRDAFADGQQRIQKINSSNKNAIFEAVI